MNTREVRKKNVYELKEELSSSLREQFNLRMQRGIGNEKTKSHLYKKVRKHIARIKTVISEKGRT